MVHFGYTGVANAAVMRPLGLPVAALVTERSLALLLNLRNRFGSPARSLKVGNHTHDHSEVEHLFSQKDVCFILNPLIQFAVHQVSRGQVHYQHNQPHGYDE